MKQRGVQREAEADAAAAARVEAETRSGRESARADALQAELLTAEEEKGRLRKELADWRRQFEEGCAKLSQVERAMDDLSQVREPWMT